MATKNNPGRYDCYANADPDEPMFVLLGRDKHAPTLVWLWAVLRELDGEDPVKVREARECCADMIAWTTVRGRPAAGIGEAVLAGTLELIRSANAAVKDAKNFPTGIDTLRRMLAETKI
jgi:hypothetical protein